jgi:hypothetical protein
VKVVVVVVITNTEELFTLIPDVGEPAGCGKFVGGLVVGMMCGQKLSAS